MSKLAASASSAFFAFAPGFGEGVPVRQLAENVIGVRHDRLSASFRAAWQERRRVRG
jgi:hypothetical protein